MATYIASGVRYEITPGAGNALSAAVPNPAGMSVNDTIFYAAVVPNLEKANYIAPGGAVAVTDWVVGVFSEPTYLVPAFRIWRLIHTGPGSYTFTYDQDSVRGAHIQAHGYSGDTTVQQTATDTDGNATGARDGPTLTAPSGNTMIGFHGGSAVAGSGVAWAGGFTERAENEYYGLQSIADQAGSGAAMTPSLTPDFSSQSMWILADIGVTSPWTPQTNAPELLRVVSGIGRW